MFSSNCDGHYKSRRSSRLIFASNSARMKYFFLLIIIALSFYGCQHQPSGNTSANLLAEAHPGKKLMETNCYLCHSPHAPELEGRVGPPMVAVKAHYMGDATSLEQFTQDMAAFLSAPDTVRARLKEDVRRYGLMPYQQFSPEMITQIAEYMYRYQIAEPEWFAAAWAQKTGQGPYQQPGLTDSLSANTPKSKSDIGLEYALETKKVLGKNLMQAIQSQGPLHALEFCNTRAIPLTDSMAQHYATSIRRVSDKPRNPDNEANAEELKYIELFKKQVAAGQDPLPVVLERQGIAQFYYPIVTNSMCLQCHGKSTDLKPEVAQKIRSLYPADKATGYSENEVRGIWSVGLK